MREADSRACFVSASSGPGFSTYLMTGREKKNFMDTVMAIPTMMVIWENMKGVRKCSLMLFREVESTPSTMGTTTRTMTMNWVT